MSKVRIIAILKKNSICFEIDVQISDSVPPLPVGEAPIAIMKAEADQPYHTLHTSVIANTFDGNYSTDPHDCYMSNMRNNGWAIFRTNYAHIQRVSVLSRSDKSELFIVSL